MRVLFRSIPGDFLIAARVMPAVICEVKELLQDVFDGIPLVAGPRPHTSLQGLEVGNQRTLCVVVAAQEPAVTSVLDCGQMGRGLLVVAEIGRASCRERVCQYVWISG